ncbi:hypothetical protein [Desulfobacula sp.]|uniref:hypothetical protein n=1 Tax=Desulfobacula sp. TaxID=2593537 RepID=UPI002617A5FD|nr:hypothetical protein [Desulfobacula sp.]
MSDDAWNIKTFEFSNQAVVIDKKILHSTPMGFLRSKHVPLIDKMRFQCQSDLPGNSALNYIIINGGRLKGTSRSARFKLMQSLKDWA